MRAPAENLIPQKRHLRPWAELPAGFLHGQKCPGSQEEPGIIWEETPVLLSCWARAASHWVSSNPGERPGPRQVTKCPHVQFPHLSDGESSRTYLKGWLWK